MLEQYSGDGGLQVGSFDGKMDRCTNDVGWRKMADRPGQGENDQEMAGSKRKNKLNQFC
jgi:hypothetical protein